MISILISGILFIPAIVGVSAVLLSQDNDTVCI